MALALHAPSGLVVSGCGTPSYPVAYEPGPYRATVKLWKLAPLEDHLAAEAVEQLPARALDGELMHTLEGHTGAVRKLLLLDAPTHGNAPPSHAASGGDDGSVIVWNVREGRNVRTLLPNPDVGACGQPRHGVLARSGVVGLALLPGPGWHAGEAEGELLLSADEDFCLYVWDWRAGTLLRALRGFNHVEGFYHGVATQHDALSSIALHASSSEAVVLVVPHLGKPGVLGLWVALIEHSGRTAQTFRGWAPPSTHAKA